MHHMHWVSLIGYFAAFLVACTFYMRTTIPLRIFAIGSNISFVFYAVLHHPILYPVLVLHLFLLPLNITRLRQVKKLIRDAKAGVHKEQSFDWLLPYMKKQTFHRGAVLFLKNDKLDKLYFIKKGIISLPEIDLVIGAGEMIGEIGALTAHEYALTSAICQDEVEALYINETEVLALYYQNPNFGLSLLQILMKRFADSHQALQGA